MKFKQVTLFGATGLIGGYLLEFLLKDSDTHLINLVGRKPFHLQHDKINNIIIDFEDFSSISNSISGSEVVFEGQGRGLRASRNASAQRQGYRFAVYRR